LIIPQSSKKSTFKFNKVELIAGKAPQRDVAQTRPENQTQSPRVSPIQENTKTGPLNVPNPGNESISKEMLASLTTDKNEPANLFNIPRGLWPRNPETRRIFARMIIEQLVTLPEGQRHPVLWYDLFEFFPVCGILGLPPEQRMVEKQRYLEDLAIALEYIKFGDAPSTPKTLTEATRLRSPFVPGMFSGVRLYDDVVIADAIEGGTRFRDLLYALCEPMQDHENSFARGTMEDLRNPNAVEPDSELAKKRDAILTALAEASALESQPGAK
jgi:hypothetical protein